MATILIARHKLGGRYEFIAADLGLTIESEESGVVKDGSPGLGDHGKSKREARFNEVLFFFIFTFFLEIKTK